MFRIGVIVAAFLVVLIGAAGAGTASTITIGGTTYTANGGANGTSDIAVAATVVAGGTATNGNVANVTGAYGEMSGTGKYTKGGSAMWGTGGINVANAVNGVAGNGFCAGGSGAASAGSSQTGGAGVPGIIHIVLSGA